MTQQRMGTTYTFFVGLLALVVAGVFAWRAAAEDAPAQAPGGYQVIEVKDGGSLTGVATWKGEIPKLPPVTVFKHMDICGQTTVNPVLQVDPNSKGLRFVLVYLEDIKSGKAPEAKYLLHMGKTPQRPDSNLCNFEEHIFPFVRTKTFALQNFEKLLHNPHGFGPSPPGQIYGQGGATLFNVAMPDPLKIVDKKFPRAKGVGLRYQCDTHVHMNGWMHGFDHPYFTTTDHQGKFEIKDIPPGTYKVVAWHEGYNIVKFGDDNRPQYDEPHIIEKTVEVKAGQATTVDFQFPVRDVKVEWKVAKRKE